MIEKTHAAIDSGVLKDGDRVILKTFETPAGRGLDGYTGSGVKFLKDVNSRNLETHTLEAIEFGALARIHGWEISVQRHTPKAERTARI